MITFLKHGDIDRKKWDHCVMNSRQGLVYSLSWYLDMVSPGWAGLVEDDYKSVMGLPVRKKFGINYIYQALFTQQLGIYSRITPDPQKSMEFINAIPKEFKYIEYNFNHLQEFSGADLKLEKRINYELKLNKSYDELANKFSDNTKRNIRKTLANIEVVEEVSIRDIVSMKRQNAILKRDPQYYEWLNCFMDTILSRGKGFILGAEYEGVLVGVAFFIFNAGRLYYLIPVSNDTGIKERAMFAILDHVIGKYADTGLILDFEGSEIKGIARFFAGFGASPVYYNTLKINRLPFPYSLFKR